MHNLNLGIPIYYLITTMYNNYKIVINNDCTKREQLKQINLN